MSIYRIIFSISGQMFLLFLKTAALSFSYYKEPADFIQYAGRRISVQRFFCFPHFSCKKERLAALLSVKEIYKF